MTIDVFDPERRCNLADFDEWLPEAPATANGTPIDFDLAGEIPSGARNQTLFRLARSLKAKGLPAPAITETLVAVNRTRCRPPLEDREGRTGGGACADARRS